MDAIIPDKDVIRTMEKLADPLAALEAAGYSHTLTYNNGSRAALVSIPFPNEERGGPYLDENGILNLTYGNRIEWYDEFAMIGDWSSYTQIYKEEFDPLRWRQCMICNANPDVSYALANNHLAASLCQVCARLVFGAMKVNIIDIYLGLMFPTNDAYSVSMLDMLDFVIFYNNRMIEHKEHYHDYLGVAVPPLPDSAKLFSGPDKLFRDVLYTTLPLNKARVDALRLDPAYKEAFRYNCIDIRRHLEVHRDFWNHRL